MGDTDNARARREAVQASSRASAGANRQRLWAGMNRYLAAEAEHAHRVEEEADAETPDEAPDGPARGADPGDGPA